MSAAATGAGVRAQANLPAFAIAVLVVTSTATLSLLVANGAFVAADREPVERTQAAGLAAAMVDADSPVTRRANVVDATSLPTLDDEFDAWFPTGDVSVRVALDDRVLVERGSPTGGTTIRRLVLVATPDTRTLSPAFSSSETAVTLPRRASTVDVTLAPSGRTTVTTVRVGDRVVLHDPGGLTGTYTVALSRFETATLRFETTGGLGPGDVELTYRPTATRKAVLAVTVDA